MKPEPIIDIDLGDNGGRIVFRSIKDAYEWVNRETEFWSWMTLHLSSNIQVLPAIISHYTSRIANIQQAITALQEPTNPNYQSQINQISNLFTTYYGGKEILHSTSIGARFVADLKLHLPLEAIAANGYLVNFPSLFSNTLTPTLFRGVFEASLFEKGIKSNVKHERKALEELKSEFQNTIENFTTDIYKLQNDHENAVEAQAKLKATQASQFAEIISNSEEKLINKLSETDTELQNITKTYDEKLALEAPVRYWKNKRKNHTAAKKNLFIWLIVFVVASLILLFSGYHALLADFEPGETPDYWRLGVAITFLSTVFWIARILVRIYLSHLHLEEDAFQRITMIQTFLSLMRRGKLPKDEDMNLILTALFRPNGDGLVKDEGVPSALFELIKRGERP
jgi:Family of unknown function (DUF6161)